MDYLGHGSGRLASDGNTRCIGTGVDLEGEWLQDGIFLLAVDETYGERE